MSRYLLMSLCSSAIFPLQDTFSIGVSFLSGKVVYISPQASSMLRCKPERLQGALFSALLAPQAVSTFYSSTAPCRLPAWASCTGSGESPPPETHLDGPHLDGPHLDGAHLE